VVAFNAAEGWARDVTEAVIARKQWDRPFSPAAALAMGRALILSGLKRGDPQLARAGKGLLAKANAELDSEGPKHLTE
jgi:hypothetical protein